MTMISDHPEGAADHLSDTHSVLVQSLRQCKLSKPLQSLMDIAVQGVVRSQIGLLTTVAHRERSCTRWKEAQTSCVLTAKPGDDGRHPPGSKDVDHWSARESRRGSVSDSLSHKGIQIREMHLIISNGIPSCLRQLVGSLVAAVAHMSRDPLADDPLNAPTSQLADQTVDLIDEEGFAG
jgi:hypothetical protein